MESNVSAFLDLLRYCNPSNFSLYISCYTTSSFTFFHPCFPLRVCVCVRAYGRQWQGSAVVCVWTHVRQLPLVRWRQRITMHVGFTAQNRVWWVCVLFGRSLIQHPHWSACRSAVNTVTSLSLPPLPHHGGWRLALSVRVCLFVCPTDRLTHCLFSSFVRALQFLAESLPSVSPSLNAVCLSFIFLHRPSTQQYLVSRRRCDNAVPASFSSVPLPLPLAVYPLTSPSGATRAMKMWSVPKTVLSCSSSPH